ncbi:MAG: DUF3467 domain-containing protein [Patescibacteria group bacterium]
MGDTPKVFSNYFLIGSSGNETQIVFFQDRPTLDQQGKPITIKEERVVVSMTFEGARKFQEALEKNIKEHEDKRAKATEGERK